MITDTHPLLESGMDDLDRQADYLKIRLEQPKPWVGKAHFVSEVASIEAASEFYWFNFA